MYTHNTTSAADRPLETWACYGLVGSAILYGVCRFWDLHVPAGVLLTPPFLCLSLLLSRVALRIEEAIKAKAWVTLAAVIILGIACAIFESAMTHMGLEWLNAREHFAPEWALWPASLALSAFNVGSVYAFARELAKPATKSPGQILAIEGWKKRKAA